MRKTIEDVLARKGQEEYAGEPVSQLQHALQCAQLAKSAGADNALITAALLHDIGHLADTDPDTLAANGTDGRHEDEGAAWLGQWFGPDVTEPVRLHVAAKRYLCTTDATYRAGLSPASQRSLELQGGIFTNQEAEDWIGQPGARNALRLRHWDDLAKDPEAETDTLTHFLEIAETVAK